MWDRAKEHQSRLVLVLTILSGLESVLRHTINCRRRLNIQYPAENCPNIHIFTFSTSDNTCQQFIMTPSPVSSSEIKRKQIVIWSHDGH